MIDLSVIIPAHNEAARIKKTINAVNKFLQYRPYRSEIIIVENGSTDNTAAIVKDYQKSMDQDPNPLLRLIRQPIGDKGKAVAAGMLAAQGWCRYMADADLSTPIWILEDFIYTMKMRKADIVIGHRNDAQGLTPIRKIMSVGFSTATKMILGPGIKDTQAGFKLFSAKAAKQIFPLLQIYGWAFDVEVLFLARLLDLEIQQMAIPWESQPGSKVRFVDPFKMLMDLIKIKQAHKYEIEV